MEVQPKRPSAKGPAESFSGDVWVDQIAYGQGVSRVRVAIIHFTPGARSAWHCHAVGQTLYVTEGRGLVQARGGGALTIQPGDVIHTPADEWHWHGATPDHFMTHVSITEGAPDGGRPDVDWGDHVTDAEYRDAQ